MDQLVTVLLALATLSRSDNAVKWIMTATDHSKTFELQSPLTPIDGAASDLSNVVTIDEDTTYQKVYGFGAAVTCCKHAIHSFPRRLFSIEYMLFTLLSHDASDVIS